MAAEAPNVSPTPFEVANEQIGEVRVLSVSGELDLGTAPQRFIVRATMVE